jgi:hypothetical protein
MPQIAVGWCLALHRDDQDDAGGGGGAFRDEGHVVPKGDEVATISC